MIFAGLASRLGDDEVCRRDRRAVVGRAAVVLLALATGCVASNTTICADGRVCPEGTACDETHALCVMQSQLDDCAGKVDNEPCNVNGTNTVCRDQVCLLQFCGDGIKNAGEQCDTDDLGGVNCIARGFYEPDGLACSASCTFDTTACAARCGDAILNGDELCDGAPPTRNACTRLGYDAGLLACNAQCSAGTDACRTFGWTAEEDVDLGYVRAIWANSPDDIFVGGSAGVFHFDGSAWTAEDTGLTGAATGIWGRAGEVFVASGSGEVAHLVNGTWSVEMVGAYLPAISGSGTEAYVVGATNGFSSYAVFRSSSGGAWSIVPGFSSTTYELSIVAMGPTDVYVADNLGVQRWNGTAWTRSLSTDARQMLLYRVGQDLYAMARGTLYRRDANGWTQIQCPFVYLGALTGSGPNDLYAVGGIGGFFHYDGNGWISIAAPTTIGEAAVQLAPGELIAGGQGVSRYHGDGRIDMTSKLRPSFKAVYAKSAADIVAVGESGLVARYSGDRWHLETTPTAVNLLDVWGDFAVGTDGNNSAILRWSGTAWTAMSFPAPVATKLRSVWGSGPSNVYAVGDGGVALRYNGSSWTALTVPTVSGNPLNFVAVWGTADNDVYFAGNDQSAGGGYIVTGGPSTFTTLQAITSTSDFVSDVWASGPGDVWLVGTRGGVYNGSGTTFTAIQSGTVSDLAYITGTSADDFRVALKVGYDASDQYIAWSSGTQTFSEKLYFCDNIYTHQRIPLVGMAAVQAGDYVAVGANANAIRDRAGRCTLEMGTDFAQDAMSPSSDAPNQLYYTTRMFGDARQVMHYDGEIVSGVDTGVIDADLVWASSPNDVWAVASYTSTYAHFNGTSWTSPSIFFGFRARAIGGSGPNDVWIVGDDDKAMRYDGLSWTSHPIPVTGQSTTYHAVWSVAPDRAFAASWDGARLLQCWNGATWSTCPGAMPHTQPFAAFGGSGPNDVYAVGPSNLVAHWNGTTWTETAIEHPNAFVGVAAAAPNDVFAIDYLGAMMHFDGTQWSPVQAGTQRAFAGLTYSNGVFWSVASYPEGAAAGLVRATPW